MKDNRHLRVMDAYIKYEVRHFDVACRGCGEIIPGQWVNKRQYHDKCQPCMGCDKVTPERGTNMDGFHYDCQPCDWCKKAIPGTALYKDRFHYDCYRERQAFIIKFNR